MIFIEHTTTLADWAEHYQDRYTTVELAEQGHQHVVTMLAELTQLEPERCTRRTTHLPHYKKP